MGNISKVINLCEGINLHHISDKTAGKFKTAVICILIRNKLTRKNATINAIIPYILQNGSKKYRNITEINTAMENMYGAAFDVQIIKKGEEQIIQFYMEFVNGRDGEFTGNMGLAIEFLSEIMLHPLAENGSFSEEAVEIGKRDVKNMIDGRMNNKIEYARQRCMEEMCADEPFGISADGYAEDLDGLDRQKIYERYLELLRLSPIEFIFSGDIDIEFCTTKAKELFLPELESLGRSRSREDFIIQPAAITPKTGEIKIIRESMDISQGKICMGYRADIDPASDEFCALLIFNEILGGAANSRLFVEVREKKNLCYYINSFIYRFKSIPVVQSGTDNRDIDALMESVRKQIMSMGKPGGISDEELESAKKSLIMKYRGITDNQNSMISFCLSQYLLDDGNDLEGFISNLAAVGKEAVCIIASKIKSDTIFILSGEGK